MILIQVTILCPICYEECLEDLFRQNRICCFHSAKVDGYCSHPNFYASDWKDVQIKLQSVLSDEDWLALKTQIEILKREGSLTEGLIMVRKIDEVLCLGEDPLPKEQVV